MFLKSYKQVAKQYNRVTCFAKVTKKTKTKNTNE